MLKFFNCKYSKEIGIDPGSNSINGSAACVSDRFVALASAFSGGDHIGLQFIPSESGFKVSVLSDKKELLDGKDLKWVFERYEAGNETAVTGIEPDKGCRLFAIRIPSRNFSIESEEYYQSRYFGELIDLMTECGVTMQIILGRRKGVVLFKAPQDLPLRLRARLSSFFCGSAIVPADELSKDDLKTNNVFMKIFIRTFLSELGCRNAEKQNGSGNSGSELFDPYDLEDNLDDELDEDPDEDPDTILTDGFAEPSSDEQEQKDKTTKVPVTIEEMDFSVRTYNCLKRAGINNAEQLQKLTEKEVSSFRFMSQKGIEEIRTKLMEMFGTSFAKPDQKSYMEQLDDLIGLDDVKEQVRRIAAFARMKKAFADQGREDISIALNMALTGNPGTAKTTVARIMAGIFCEIGITKSYDLIEVGRSDLVGEYVGKTAIKVDSVFGKAKGKVLFIDEAYSLIDNTANSFGDEAINSLVRHMENNRKDTIVIFAGYSDKMESFLSRNPGLRSRIPFVIEFKDYSPETLVRIAEKEASDFGFAITEEGKDKIFSLCSDAAKEPEFGNGRFCRNLVENALLDYAAAVYDTDPGENIPEPVLDAVHFTLPLNMKKTRTPKKFGFI